MLGVGSVHAHCRNWDCMYALLALCLAAALNITISFASRDTRQPWYNGFSSALKSANNSWESDRVGSSESEWSCSEPESLESSALDWSEPLGLQLSTACATASQLVKSEANDGENRCWMGSISNCASQPTGMSCWWWVRASCSLWSMWSLTSSNDPSNSTTGERAGGSEEADEELKRGAVEGEAKPWSVTRTQASGT